MKKICSTLLSTTILLTSCQKNDAEDKDKTITNRPMNPNVNNTAALGLHVFNRVDQFSMRNNVRWAYSFDGENPTFNMSIYCGSNEGECHNELLDSGKMVLETKQALRTETAADLKLAIYYAGMASKYSDREDEFDLQPFFSVKLVYNLKNDLGQLEERTDEFVLAMKDVAKPTIEDWRGDKKNIVYGKGDKQEIFKTEARIEGEAEGIKVQIHQVGASGLQIHKIEVQM